MAKPSEQYPSHFSMIGRRTVSEGEWELVTASKAEANSGKIQWYAYTRALQREQKFEMWVEAVRVMASTRDNVIIFSDRDKKGIGAALSASFADYTSDYTEDPAGKAFKEMMKAKAAKEGEV